MGKMRRRLRGLGSSATAAIALSFLDIVSAGFGGAVFLFVVFASLPIDTRAPATGGGGRFIDVLVEWPRLAVRESERTVIENDTRISKWWYSWRWLTMSARIKSAIDPDCDWLKGGEITYWVHPMYIEYGEIFDPGNQFDIPNDSLIYDEGCRFYYYSPSIDQEDIGTSTKGREPVVDLHIEYSRPPQGRPYQTRLSVLAKDIDSNTDIYFVPRNRSGQHDEMPWDSIHVTGFDPFGRYERLNRYHNRHTMHIRVLGPRGGSWRFKAKVYSAGSAPSRGVARDSGSIEVNVTIHCPDTSGPVHDETKETLNLPITEFGPLPIEGLLCEFEILD